MQGRSHLVVVVCLLVLTAGCLGGLSFATDQDASPNEAMESTPGPVMHALVIESLPSDDALVEPEILDVKLEQNPSSAATIHEGPDPIDGEDGTILAAFGVEEGHALEPLELQITVHDGLGPALLSVQVPSWTSFEDARLTLHLGMPDVGVVTVDRIDGDHHAEPLENPSTPQYGALHYGDGAVEALDAFPYDIDLPEDYPRFGPNAEPTFTIQEDDANVEWRLEDDIEATGPEATVNPGPGKHTLTVEDPASGATVDLTFSIHHQFSKEGVVLVGTMDHRESVGGVNEDTYAIQVHEGARMMRATLEPIGPSHGVNEVDLYALNETGHIQKQSVDEGMNELLVLPRSLLLPGETVYLQVHGDTAALSEYKLTVRTFYTPW